MNGWIINVASGQVTLEPYNMPYDARLRVQVSDGRFCAGAILEVDDAVRLRDAIDQFIALTSMSKEGS